MRKTSLIAGVTALLIGTAATATENYSSYRDYVNKHSNTTKSFNFGVSNGSVNDSSGSGVFIGYGFDNTNNKAYTTKKLYMGGDFHFGINSIENTNVVNFGGDFKLGMNVLPQMSVYGIGSFLIQDTDSFSAYGLGIGMGTEWRINKKFAAVVDYKAYSMTPDSTDDIDYDYDQTSLYVKYRF